MDADLVAFRRHAAHLVGIQLGGHRGVEEAGRDSLPFQQATDARHGLAIAVLALADAHRTLVTIAQRNCVVVRIEGYRDGTARAVGPGAGGEAAGSAGNRPQDELCTTPPRE